MNKSLFNVLIVGSNGNMGRRYYAILQGIKDKNNNIEIGELDLNDKTKKSKYKSANYIILATPTEEHYKNILEILKTKTELNDKTITHILCEKPISKNIEEIENLYYLLNKKDCKVKLYMVNNYAYIKRDQDKLIKRKPCYALYQKPISQFTSYDYYNTGKDGLYWDLIQIIYLSRKYLSMNNLSPIWKCCINGKNINRGDIDGSYVSMIEDFLGNRKNMWGIEDIKLAHLKVLKYEK